MQCTVQCVYQALLLAPASKLECLGIRLHLLAWCMFYRWTAWPTGMFYRWTAWPTGTVHVLLVDCLAQWNGTWSTSGLLGLVMVHGLLAWCMVYWLTVWPTDMVHGLLAACLAYWHGAWCTVELIGLLVWCMAEAYACRIFLKGFVW